MLKKEMPPSHPGKILKDLYLEPLGLGQAEAAENLGVTRKTLSMLVNEHQGLSAEMALRLAKAFNTTPELWLNMQNSYDLWMIKRKLSLSEIRVFRMARSKPNAGKNEKKARATSRTNIKSQIKQNAAYRTR